jgi:hypothetical protein
MKALSIRQPWAWLIVQGHKDVENRIWNTKFRGRFLVHASARPERELERIRADVLDRFHLRLPDTFELGGIVGEVELYDVIRPGELLKCGSAWFTGPYGWLLRGARALPFRALRGKLQWFEGGPRF